VIFPLTLNQKLVNWVGRSIGAREPRYLNLQSAVSTKSLVWNYDQLMSGGQVLIITEGPMDALKVDVYGKASGWRATCLFGTGITSEQEHLLRRLGRNFRAMIALGDERKGSNAWILRSQLFPLPVIIGRLPSGVEDPGALSPREVRTLISQSV
jgi:hypothetical protein